MNNLSGKKHRWLHPLTLSSAGVKRPFSRQHVRISNSNYLWTLAFSTHSHPEPPAQPRVPLVLLHGFGGGVALWAQNLDSLSSSGPVYALDLLGFGRSSHPNFATNPEGAEEQFVTALEEWREKVGLEEMVLLGHNLGGYLSAAYTLKYPHRCSAGRVCVGVWMYKNFLQQKTAFFIIVCILLHSTICSISCSP